MNIIFGFIIGFIILYLLAIMPRMSGEPDKTPFMHVFYAHRGFHDNRYEWPENSMRAFAKAVEHGYGIEMDVQLSKDGVPVVFHDFTLERVCGIDGKVSQYTWQELQSFGLFDSGEKIPSLEEVLHMVNGVVPLIVELKIEWTDVAVCPAVDAVFSSYKGAYCIESFNPLGLLWYRKNRNEVMRGQLSDGFLLQEGMKGIVYFVVEYLLSNCITKPDFIAYNHKYHNNISRVLCQKMYKALSVGYTIKSQQQLEAAKGHFSLFIFDDFQPE